MDFIDISSSDEERDNDSENDTKKVLFMARDNWKQYPKYDEDEGEVYLEMELVSALKSLKIERKNVKALEVELSELRNTL